MLSRSRGVVHGGPPTVDQDVIPQADSVGDKPTPLDLCCIGGPGTDPPSSDSGISREDFPQDRISREGIRQFMSSHAIGDDTVCVVYAHGLVDAGGKHTLLTRHAAVGGHVTTSTPKLLRWIRNLPGHGGQAPIPNTVYKGPIWLMSCHAEAVLAELKRDPELLAQGYIVVCGSDAVLHREIADANLKALGNYLAGCRERNEQPIHANVFLESLVESAETATMLGGDLESPIVSRAPSTFQEFTARYRGDSERGTSGAASRSAREAWLVMAARAPTAEVQKLAQAHPELLTSHGHDALVEACRSGRCETARWLIDAGVLAGRRSRELSAVLVALCSTDPSAERAAAVLELTREFLRQFPACGIADSTNPDHPLVYAAVKGNVALMRLLIESGSPIHVRARGGRTPLIAACLAKRPDVLDALLATDASPATLNAADPRGNTALMHAAAMGLESAVKRLAARGAKLNIQNNDNQTALAIACRRGDLDMVRLLLELGAKGRQTRLKTFDMLCKKGRPRTAAQRVEIAKLLIARGILPGKKHSRRAKAAGHEELSVLLAQHVR